MGIGRAEVALLLEERRYRPFVGSIGTLGRQTIHAPQQELNRLFLQEGIPLTKAATTDAELFKTMGFETIESLDYSSFENATHIVDLNVDIPEHLANRFDVVLDGGTLEHVFNFPVALKNTIRLTKIGGRIIYILPVTNHVDHGFYMFSPTLFMDYFTANKIRVETFYLIRYSPDPRKLWHAYRYEKDSFSKLSIGCLDRQPYMLFAVVTRQPESTWDRIPHQAHYQKTWAGESISDTSALYKSTQQLIGWLPGAMSAAVFLRNLTKPRDIRTLRYVGRY